MAGAPITKQKQQQKWYPQQYREKDNKIQNPE